jgi:hypothetical protein
MARNKFNPPKKISDQTNLDRVTAETRWTEWYTNEDLAKNPPYRPGTLWIDAEQLEGLTRSQEEQAIEILTELGRERWGEINVEVDLEQNVATEIAACRWRCPVHEPLKEWWEEVWDSLDWEDEDDDMDDEIEGPAS